MTDNNAMNKHTQTNKHSETLKTEPSLVPKGLTIGLAVFAVILSLAGYVFRVLAGDPFKEVLQHAMVLVPFFVVVIPAGFWLGAVIMNKIKGMHIQRRNALTLGWLISCVTMLWFMGTYS